MSAWVREGHLEMLVQLVHQAGEELVGVLLLPNVQLLVPHLEDLQQTKGTNPHNVIIPQRVRRTSAETTATKPLLKPPGITCWARDTNFHEV